MKPFIAFYTIATCLLGAYSSSGQVTSFTGKIVNESNVPIPGSHITLYKSGKTTRLIADVNGVFHAEQIPAGDYHTDIIAEGRLIRAKKLYIQPVGQHSFYYNFKLFSRGVVISIMNGDGLATSMMRP